MAGFDVYLADTKTGKIWEKLEATGTIGDGLNGDGVTGRFTVAPYKGLRDRLVAPWRACIVVADEAHVYWAGPVPDAQPSGRGKWIDVNGSSIWGILDRRPAWRTVSRPPNEAADLGILSGSLSQLGAQLMNFALAWGSLPVVVPSQVSLPAGGNTREYLSYELNSIGKLLRNLTDDDGGRLDVHFQPRWKAGLHDAFEWVMRVGEPLGRPGFPHRWDSGSDAVVSLTPQLDGSEYATDAWVSGAGDKRERVVGHGHSNLPESRGWPAIHLIDTSSNDTVELVSTADGYAQAQVNKGLRMTNQIAPVVRIDKDPMFGFWQLGDLVRFDTVDDLWYPDGYQTGQISAWSHTLGTNDVALTLADQATTTI